MTNPKRRESFKNLFRLYPALLHAFAEQNCDICGRNAAEIPRSVTDIKKLLIAQFAVRLLKTRAKGATPQMMWFAFEATDRYIHYKQALFPDCEIIASEKHRLAFTKLEEEFASVIFEALVTEAAIPTVEFDEVAFWRDVLLGLADNEPFLFLPPLSKVALDHIDELGKALAA